MCGGPSKPTSLPPHSLPSSETVKAPHAGDLEPSLFPFYASTNDVSSIKAAAEGERESINASSLWYARLLDGSSVKMGLAKRTPLMIAALYGCTDVINYLLQFNVDVNQRSETDGATALHLAAAGGSPNSLDAVKILIDAGADINAVDHAGRLPGDVIARQTARNLEGVLKAVCLRASSPALLPPSSAGAQEKKREYPPDATLPPPSSAGAEEKKREYPPDATLPDIKNGIYGTDEFRMYSFKVKPCSRAYSHDWTECPFVHPGENARRRDLRKHLYSCVPCPEFRKGSCRNGDACEYAHGVFECWLHPAQYRTRMCKDYEKCNRRICFFAHREEELRTVNPTAASVNGMLPSPRSASNFDMAAAAMLMSSPLSPSAVSAGLASQVNWMSHAPAPTLQLPSSRLMASLSARDLDVGFQLLGLESYQQKLLDEIQAAAASPRTTRLADYSNLFGSQIANQSLAHQQLLTSCYGNNLPSSPTLNSAMSSSFGVDHSMAKATMKSRAAAFANRSQSFIDRGAVARVPSVFSTGPATSTAMGLSDWSSADRKVDWGIEKKELNLLRKSATFSYRNTRPVSPPEKAAPADEPDFSWVQSLVRDGPAVSGPVGGGAAGGGDFIGAEKFSPWGEEQLVA